MQEQLIAIRANLSANAFWLAALKLHGLLGKANFNRNQPRVPRGFREGGQWTREGGPRTPTIRPKLDFDQDGKPNLPATRPDDVQVRNSLSRQTSRWVAKRPSPIGIAVDLLSEFDWLLEDGMSFLSNLDPPQTLEVLFQRAILIRALKRQRAFPGYQLHHIVEQAAARGDGISEALIDGAENLVSIPKYRHEEITTWFGTSNWEFGGLSPRQYLVGRTWEERYRLGLKALRIYGVLKP